MKINSMAINRLSYWGLDARTTEQLLKVSSRMGLVCQEFKANDSDADGFDILIIDIAYYFSNQSEAPSWNTNLAVVGMLAHGTPTEISKALKLGATAVLHKPINQNALFSALSMARGMKNKEIQQMADLNDLKFKQERRTVVIKVTLMMMERYHVDVDKALKMLRNLSMNHNCSIEELCEKLAPELSELKIGRR